MFENLKLINYKGLKECELKNLGQINVICGKNNSGKSTILEVISSQTNRFHGKLITENFIDEILEKTNKAFNSVVSSAQIKIKRRFLEKTFPQGSYWYENRLDEIRKILTQTIRNEGHPTQVEFHIFDKGFLQLFQKNIDVLLIPPKRQLELSKSIQANDAVTPNGIGILNQLFYFRNQPEGTKAKNIYNKVREHFTEISGGYYFDIYMSNTNTAILNFSKGRDEWIAASNCGLGLQDLLVILWFAINPERQVVLIEEPESHIHPEMQRKLLQFLRNQQNKQFFLSSHSNVFLSSAYADKVFFTQFDENIKVLDATSRAGVLNDLGYSITDNLASDLVILVEGPTDAPVIEEFLIKKGAYSNYAIRIWPLGGDIMDQLDLSVFSPNYKLIALIDSDPGSGNIRKKFAEKCAAHNIPIHKADRYSIENYFSIRALREVFVNQIDSAITEIKPYEKLENQIGINVKKNNRKIAQTMTLDEIAGTDLEIFLDEVIEICKS